MADTYGLNIELSRVEVVRLHEEIGDIPKSRVGPKLLQLYRRLESYIDMTAPPPPKGRRRKSSEEIPSP